MRCHFSHHRPGSSGVDGADETSSDNNTDYLRSLSNSPLNRRKQYRKSRKRRSSEVTSPGLVRGPTEDDEETDFETLPPIRPRLKRRGAGQHHSASPHKIRFRFNSPKALKRAQSSPSQLVIRDADLLQKVKDTLTACSTPIKLEDRRKYAPLTPAGHDRPKLLASSNGHISVEPTFRKSLSQGNLVKGSNLVFDNAKTKHKMAAATAAPAAGTKKSKTSGAAAAGDAPSKWSSPFKHNIEKMIKQQNEIGKLHI